uniref:Uncharacterized protein n=1 Tax=Anguilla anguilla TaxID=7936 RepID=A0A0E9UTQ1_ANGAN
MCCRSSSQTYPGSLLTSVT